MGNKKYLHILFSFFFNFDTFSVFSNNKVYTRQRKKGWFVTSLRRFASFIRRNTESLTKVHVEKGRNRGIVGKESLKKTVFFFQEIVFMNFTHQSNEITRLFVIR